MLPGIPGAPFAFKDSMIHKFCNSHYVSQLAAFFIDARAKRSTVISCLLVLFFGFWKINRFYKRWRFFRISCATWKCGRFDKGLIHLKDLTRGICCWFIHKCIQCLIHTLPKTSLNADELAQFTQWVGIVFLDMVMILPQVHLRKPCYDFYFL